MSERNDGSGSNFFDPGREGWVSHLWLGYGFGKFPLKNFFLFGSKKISSGRVKKYPGRRQVGLLFTAGQK